METSGIHLEQMWTSLQDVVYRYLGIPPHTFEKLLLSVLVIIVYFVVVRIVRALVARRIKEITRLYIARKTVNYIVGFVAFLVLLRVWLGGTTGIAAYLGLLSAGLAIALQTPLTNLAGWIFIAVRKPFVVGDRIEINGHRGDVIDLRLFQFSLIEIGQWVDADQSTGRIIHIPNGWAFQHSQANYTQGFNFIWDEMPITLTFESNWEKAKKLLEDIANAHSALKSEEAERQVRNAARKYMIFFQHLTSIVWTDVADHGVTLTVRYLCKPRERRSTASAIWEDVLRAFHAEDDIDFAYPTTRFYDNAREGKPGARASAPGS